MADLVPSSDLPEAPQTPETQSNPVPTDDLPQEAQSTAVPQSDLPDEAPKHDSLGQLALTGVEGAARGITGGLSDVALKGARNLAEEYTDNPDAWAPRPEDVQARQNENPGIAKATEIGGLAGSLIRGVGVPGMIAKGVKSLLPEATGMLAKVGSAMLAGAIEQGGIQATDETSKAMIGQGDPEAPVSSALAHIAGAGLIGGLTAGAFNGMGQAGTSGLAAIENAKIGEKATNLLAGMGIASKAHAAGVPEKEAEAWINKYFQDFGAGDSFDYKHYAPGVKMYYSGIQKAVNTAADAVIDTGMGMIGGKAFGPAGSLISMGLSQKYVVPIVEKMLNKPLVGANKLALPTIMYALSKGETSGLFNALNYATKVSKGAKAIGNGVESVFKATGTDIAGASEKDKKKIMDYIDNGGVNKEMQDSMQEAPPQQYAKGGPVMPNAPQGGLNNLYPAQAMLMGAAKSRMSNYLGSLKPQPGQKRPFDAPPDMRSQERMYDRALNVAAAPLSLLNDIRDGSLKAEQVKHLTSMYPELHTHLAKKFTERIMNAQADEEKLPYKSRQALSLFLGTELDSTMTPTSILAAQSAFIKPQAQQQMPKSGGKKGTSNLGKSNNSYKTASQAAEADTTSRD